MFGNRQLGKLLKTLCLENNKKKKYIPLSPMMVATIREIKLKIRLLKFYFVVG